MSPEARTLLRLMRCELAATNNQFMHILALGKWGEKEAVKRITQVDDVDFSNAMRIAQHLVETKTPIRLEPADFTPGTDFTTILVSERAMERRVLAAIEEADCADPRAVQLVEAARKPRDAYADWLTERLDGIDAAEQHRARDEVSDTVAQLITLMEQSLIHAFVHRRDGDAAGADAAWATSGAAMMHLTEFVHLYARRSTMPAPGVCPAPQIADRAERAHDLDRQLAVECSKTAEVAAGRCASEPAADLCGRVALYCIELSQWQSGQTHPAAASNPAAFASFEATVSKLLAPE